MGHQKQAFTFMVGACFFVRGDSNSERARSIKFFLILLATATIPFQILSKYPWLFVIGSSKSGICGGINVNTINSIAINTKVSIAFFGKLHSILLHLKSIISANTEIATEIKNVKTFTQSGVSEIQQILKNYNYSDFETVEEIVCVFEKYKIDFGCCHDF